MKITSSANEWLPWLGRVRFLVITFLVAVVVCIHQLTLIPLPAGPLVALAVVWYLFAVVDLILGSWPFAASWQAPVQVGLDLAVITAVVYASGAQDSYFVSLYLPAILMGSILFSRRGAFLTAGTSFVLLAGMVDLAYYRIIPPTANSTPSLRALESWLFINLFAFCAVAYLGSLLAQTIRTKGVELEAKSEALENLQAFNRDVIQSLRGGLLTTDLAGRVLFVNRAGEEMLGRSSGTLSGTHVAELFSELWPVAADERGSPLAKRAELEIGTPEGEPRYLGLSISRLRSGQGDDSGFVFNFQDLTEQKRLEREVAAKERMAALGRLSAAIAHEIRQPLTAMAGALKELARLAPLEEDDQKLVQIVTRESQRLNKIVTEFLDYARDKAYTFTDVDLTAVVEETLVLLVHDAASASKYRIERAFPEQRLYVRADRDALKQVLWNLFNNALRAMPEGGVLSVGLAASREWVQMSVRDTGLGFDPRVAARMFEPFQSGFTGGTGLGLAIVYQIVQGHHGRIGMTEREGPGTEFVVELPRAQERKSAGRRAAVVQPELAHAEGRR